MKAPPLVAGLAAGVKLGAAVPPCYNPPSSRMEELPCSVGLGIWSGLLS